MWIDTATEAFIAPLRTPFLDRYFFYTTDIAAPEAGALVLLMCIAMWYFCVRCRKNTATLALSTLICTVLIVTMKHAFERARPIPIEIAINQEHTFSFPSGHTVFAVAVFGTILFLSLKKVHTWSERVAISVPIILLIASTLISRVYLRVHYATDVIGGVLIGLAVIPLAYYGIKVLHSRYDRYF